MDLFDKPSDQKEFYNDGSVVINLKSNSKYKITINNNIIKVEQSGALNKLNRGLVGEKLYNLDTVTGTQLKEPGMTTGYFAIQTPGNTDLKGGVMKAVKDEDSILFTKKESDLIHQIKEYIDYYLIYKESPKRKIQQAPTVENITFDIPTETVFETAEPIKQISTVTNKENPKTKKKGFLYYIKIIGIGLLVLLLLVMMFSCFNSGGNSDSSNTSTNTEQTENQIDDYEISRLARQSEDYSTQIAQIMSNVGNNGADNTMHSLSDINVQIGEDLAKIPEDTSDPALQTIRQLLNSESNLVMAAYATLATGDTSGGDLITQYLNEVENLIPQVKQYE